MSKKEKSEKNKTEAPKKRLFNVEKKFGYTMHEIWNHKMSYGLIAPFFIVFIIFTIIPLAVSIFFSFTYYNILEAPRFVAWDNYVYLFVDDPLFLKAFSNTLFYAVIVGPVGYHVVLLRMVHQPGSSKDQTVIYACILRSVSYERRRDVSRMARPLRK